MSLDTALQLLVVAYAVIGIAVVVAGSLFTVRLFVKVMRRLR